MLNEWYNYNYNQQRSGKLNYTVWSNDLLLERSIPPLYGNLPLKILNLFFPATKQFLRISMFTQKWWWWRLELQEDDITYNWRHYFQISLYFKSLEKYFQFSQNLLFYFLLYATETKHSTDPKQSNIWQKAAHVTVKIEYNTLKFLLWREKSCVNVNSWP